MATMEIKLIPPRKWEKSISDELKFLQDHQRILQITF